MTEINWLRSDNLYLIVCRPALAGDTAEVMELTSQIWEGNDYIPLVWEDWLFDPEGLLAVAEYQGHVVGLGKLSHLDADEFWLEGLRVHPDYKGRGIASHLHNYLLGYWQEHFRGVLGVATGSDNLAVQHLCERSGFSKIGEYTPFIAGSLNPIQEVDKVGNDDIFIKLDSSEIPQALHFTLNSPSLALAYGLMDIDWRWVKPAARFFQEAVNRGQAMWWRKGLGLIIFSIREHEGEEIPTLQLIACPLEELLTCLRDFRMLAAVLNYDRASWMAPLHPELAPILDKAGFERDWDLSLYVYQKKWEGRMV